MEFTKNEFEEFRTDVENALKGIAKKYGVSISTGRIDYSTNNFEMRLKVVKTVDSKGKKLDAEKEDFARLCKLFNFKKSDYKKKFKANGREFEFIGFDIKKRKNCCIIRDTKTGKLAATSEEGIRYYLNK